MLAVVLRLLGHLVNFELSAGTSSHYGRQCKSALLHFPSIVSLSLKELAVASAYHDVWITSYHIFSYNFNCEYWLSIPANGFEYTEFSLNSSDKPEMLDLSTNN